MNREPEILQGTIAAVVFQNYDNGYAVLRLNAGGGQMVTVVRTIPMPAAGERLMVTGKWGNHPSFGRQFEAEFLERLLPQTGMEILSYLSSRIIKGIGPRMAARIVEQFGDETLLVMEREPLRLAEVSGISRETGQYESVEMLRRYLVEMVMDRRAACMTYQGEHYRDDSALIYFNRGLEKDKMHPQTREELRYILTMLAEKGEKETFAFLKEVLKGGPIPVLPRENEKHEK